MELGLDVEAVDGIIRDMFWHGTPVFIGHTVLISVGKNVLNLCDKTLILHEVVEKGCCVAHDRTVVFEPAAWFPGQTHTLVPASRCIVFGQNSP